MYTRQSADKKITTHMVNLPTCYCPFQFALYYTHTHARTRHHHLRPHCRRHEAKLVVYKFWVEHLPHAEYDRPVKLLLHGNALDGSHFDNWEYTFESFTPGLADDTTFEVPTPCEGVTPTEEGARLTSHAAQLRALLPPAGIGGASGGGGGDTHYTVFSAAHGRRHVSTEDYVTRLGAFRATAERVAAHNARADRGYSMELNRFADWTEVSGVAI